MPLRKIPSLLLLLALGIVPAHAGEKIQPLGDKLGVVSFSFREDLKKDTPGTLDKIKALGITDIEFSDLFGHTAPELRKMLDERGMTCSSFGTNYDRALAKIDDVGADAQALGAKFVRVAWIPHKGPFTIELAKKTAEDFNNFGKTLKEKYDLSFCFHNHGYEFEKYEDGTLYDQIVKLTDPAYVSFEIDILWAFYPGIDPAALLAKHGSRFKLMHVKDLRKGIKGDTSGKTDVDNDVALGTGQLDLPQIIAAAQKAGLAHYYIEDESTHSWEQVPESVKYLNSLAK